MKLKTSDIFKIDGVGYDVKVMELTETGEVLDSENSGRTQKDGAMYREIIGTYYNFELVIDREGASLADYDKVFEVLTAPVKYHIIVLPHPFKQNALMEYKAYCQSAARKLQRAYLDSNGEYTYQWGSMKIKFVAMQPQIKG